MSDRKPVPLLTRVRWPGWEPLPVEPGPTRAVLARTFLYLYGAGGTLALGTVLFLPHEGVRSDWGIAVPGLCAYAVALTMLLAFDRVPMWAFRLLPPLGTALTSVVVYSGGPSLMVPYAGFYFWVVLSSFYLFDARWAWFNVALVGAAFAFVLKLTPERPNQAITWVMVMGSLAVGGAMIGLLRSRLEGLLEELRVAFEHSHESEHALAEAQRIAAIGSWEIDLPSGKLTGSDEFKRIFSLGRDAELPIGDLTDRIHRDDREHVLQVVQRAATDQMPFELEERVVLANGDVRHIHVRGTTVAKDGQPVKLVGTAQDITERKMQEERLRGTLRRLAATTDIALALGGETSLDGLLQLIADRTRALLHAPGVAIFVVEAHAMRRAAAAGVPDAIPADLNGRGALVAPLAFRGEDHGVLVAAGRGPGLGFTDDDEGMLRAFATSAATAVAAAKSVQRDSLRRSLEASESERRRWARELHDQTLQGLGVLQMRLDTALRSGPEALDEAARAALDQIGSEVESLRRIIADLRPALLDDLGLGPALGGLADRVAATFAIDVVTSVELGDENARLDPQLEQAVYRIVQEALANVSKHAHASHVAVEVVAEADSLLVTVQDDGHGFDVDTPAEGFGLSGMRERVRLADGRLAISSGSTGTLVEAVLPLSARAPSAAAAPSPRR